MRMSNKTREMSVSNLQRLYTVVISLAITESLRRLLSKYGDTGQLPDFASVVAVISLLATVIPFYHGSNRYFELTYITRERQTKSETLMLDFISIFIEGLVFFALAIVIQNIVTFYTILAILFVFDAIWVGITNLTAIEGDQFPEYHSWAFANILASIGILVSVWSNLLKWSIWPSENVTIVVVGSIAILRTVYDYYSTWKFYYPPTPN